MEIDDAAENNYIKNFVKHLNGSHAFGWLIGATDKAVEGEYVWMNSRQPLNQTSFIDWYPSEPNNVDHDENCVTLFLYQGVTYQWRDVSCESHLHYICETYYS